MLWSAIQFSHQMFDVHGIRCNFYKVSSTLYSKTFFWFIIIPNWGSGENHDGITIMSGVEEMLLPNSRRSNHRSWTFYLVCRKYNHGNLSEVHFHLIILYIPFLWAFKILQSTPNKHSVHSSFCMDEGTWEMLNISSWNMIMLCFIKFFSLVPILVKIWQFNGHLIYACYPSLRKKRKKFTVSPWCVCVRVNAHPSPSPYQLHNTMGWHFEVISNSLMQTRLYLNCNQFTSHLLNTVL
jgi:hypothetical protein